MKSVPKGLLAALAGLAVVVALPYILAWEPPGKAGGTAVEGMETVALTSALPEGYRVDTGGEVRFVSPEEVLGRQRGRTSRTGYGAYWPIPRCWGRWPTSPPKRGRKGFWSRRG